MLQKKLFAFTLFIVIPRLEFFIRYITNPCRAPASLFVQNRAAFLLLQVECSCFGLIMSSKSQILGLVEKACLICYAGNKYSMVLEYVGRDVAVADRGNMLAAYYEGK